MRGFEKLSVADIERRNLKISEPKKSKFRNVKKRTADGHVFDSGREADYWIGLKALESCGEISELRRQVPFPLYCADNASKGFAVQVSDYLADFTYQEAGKLHVVDAKGHRTAVYKLKKKWLELQDGIIIEEV